MKRFLLNLTVFICAALFVVGLAACEGKHNWSTEWSSNDSNHWHDCTDENCKKRQDITPHDWQLEFADVPAACLDPGWGQYKCSVCGRTKEDVIPAAGHDWQVKDSDVQFQPTCITPGRGTMFCSRCGIEEKNRTIPATGVHPYDTKWTSDARGHYHVCTTKGCGAIDEIIPHVEGGERTIQEPSTSEINYNDRLIQTYCKTCEYILGETTRPSQNIPISFRPVIKDSNHEEVYIDSSNNVYLNIPKNYNSVKYEFSFTDGINVDGDPVEVIRPINDSNVAVGKFYDGVHFYEITDDGKEHELQWLYIKKPMYYEYRYLAVTRYNENGALTEEVKPLRKLLLRFEANGRVGGEVILTLHINA